jgi:CRISPR-associated endonuclease/helicase Cas3
MSHEIALQVDDFGDFFEALHGYSPFPWQARLVKEVVASGKWPDLMDLPTASGKTATIDVSIFLMALAADNPEMKIPAPRRIFFVVDRRTIVDEAFLRASRIARGLEEALQTGDSNIVGRVAKRLDELAGAIPGRKSRPLATSIMRGGISFEATWTLSPQQPSICVTTVDQLGSRLLFRGYGVSSYAAPIHAGLIAYDSLVILDEAHLSGPFRKTLEMVGHYCSEPWFEKPLGLPCIRHVDMSATAEHAATRPFRLEEEDYNNPILAQRLRAEKWASILPLSDDKKKIATQYADAALRLQEDAAAECNPVTAIVVNRVQTARLIEQELRSRKLEDVDVILLTGRSRPFERDRLVEEYRDRLLANPERNKLPQARPLIVVATQCIEAGADYDFTGLVTELAPISSLIQRAGRLDRLGLMGQSEIVIAIPEKLDEKPDPIYGTVLEPVAEYIRNRVAGSEGFDLGPEGVASIPKDVRKELDPPHGLEPTLRPADLDLLCQTTPRPKPDPDISVFLHGSTEPDRDVSLVWRADIPADIPDKAEALDPGLAEALSLIHPTAEEALQVPMWAARAWLSGNRTQSGDVADVEGTAIGVAPKKSTKSAKILRMSHEQTLEVVDVERIVPGDVILLSPDKGGCDRFGWSPSFHGTVSDLSPVLAAQGGRPFVRITEKHSDLENPEATDRVHEVLDDIATLMADDADVEVADITPALDALRDGMPELFADDRLTPYPLLIAYAPGQPRRGILLCRQRPIAARSREPFFSDSSEIGSLATPEIPLERHSDAVRDVARIFSAALDDQIASDVVFSAHQHDAGKAEPRMQAFFNGGRLRPEGAPPLAKGGTLLASQGHEKTARELSGFKAGLRHEAWSVALLDATHKSQPDSISVNDFDLCRWLVGSHHGRGRPWFAVVEDAGSSPFESSLIGAEAPVQIEADHRLYALEKGWLNTFWTVIRRYGWWGCAYLEATVRLSDHRRSEFETLATKRIDRRTAS